MTLHGHVWRHRSDGRVPSVLLALAVTTCASPARATVLVPADVTELAIAARAIARGRVTEVRAAWADGRRRIETFVTLDVAEYLKGNLGPSVTFRVPGGDFGAYRTVMIGAPVFREGDEVVLFLAVRGPSIPYLAGFSQGVFRLLTDGRTGRSMVTTPLLIGGESAVRVVRGDPARHSVTLDAFRQRIRAILASANGRNVVGGLR